jgi:hypothetical protein
MYSPVLSLTKLLTKNTTERFLGCLTLVWYYRLFTLPGESSDISAASSGSESTESINVFPDVGVILTLS